jgi:secreted protein with Ig-like and vWFA domain
VVDQSAGPSVTLEPSAEVEAPSELTTLEPLEFEPTQFEHISPPTPADPEGLEIIGIGTGSSDFDKYGFRVSSATAGPKFFGLGTEARGARKIVYVVDRSGSMLNTFHGVVRELTESIGRLRRTQKFHVIFFNAGMPLENPPRRLVSAIQAHKRDLFRFLGGITPQGQTDPKLAMQRAFAVKPDMIYFLTDGDFDRDLLSVLEKLNPDRRVRIFTIAYANPWGAETLERIAREHNGKYRFVSEEEIFLP